MSRGIAKSLILSLFLITQEKEYGTHEHGRGQIKILTWEKEKLGKRVCIH